MSQEMMSFAKGFCLCLGLLFPVFVPTLHSKLLSSRGRVPPARSILPSCHRHLLSTATCQAGPVLTVEGIGANNLGLWSFRTNRAVRQGFRETRCYFSHCDQVRGRQWGEAAHVTGESILGHGNRKCEGPEAGPAWCLRSSLRSLCLE